MSIKTLALSDQWYNVQTYSINGCIKPRKTTEKIDAVKIVKCFSA